MNRPNDFFDPEIPRQEPGAAPSDSALNSQSEPFDSRPLEELLLCEEQPEKGKKRKKFSKKKKVLLGILFGFLGLLAALVITVLILVAVGKSSLLDRTGMKLDPSDAVSGAVVENDGMDVEYAGTKYRYNQDMTGILCIGVDRDTFADGDNTYGINGQADALFLTALDTGTGRTTVIPIPRDTMADVDLYSAGGAYVSSEKKQICLSYAYGDGKKSSCENTVKSVSRLFYGLPINSYIAIDMDAIGLLTDKVGGVPVTPTSDFVSGSYRFIKGQETVLTGDKAVSYVQSRNKSDINSSLDRMARQKQFVQGFFSRALAMTKKDIKTPVSLYNAVSGSMITTLDIADISFLTSCVIGGMSGGKLEFRSMDGEMKMGEKYAEYYADEQSIYEMIIDVFYEPVS